MKHLWWIVVIVFFILAGFGLSRIKQPELTPDLSQSELIGTVEGCDLAGQSCEIQGYRLDIDRPVVPLTLLKARLQTRASIDSAVLYLEMKDMDMGINRFKLNPVEGGSWEADVMIPVCSTGRRDWLVSLVVQEKGRNYRLVYPLSVVGK
jgi:hypothetical protein